MQTVEVNLVVFHLKVGLLDDASEVQCVVLLVFDVAHAELSIEVHVDAFRGRGGVGVDDELGVLLGVQLEVVLVEAERRFCHELELRVWGRFGVECRGDADFGGFAVLGPHLVGHDDRFLDLDRRVDKIRF